MRRAPEPDRTDTPLVEMLTTPATAPPASLEGDVPAAPAGVAVADLETGRPQPVVGTEQWPGRRPD